MYKRQATIVGVDKGEFKPLLVTTVIALPSKALRGGMGGGGGGGEDTQATLILSAEGNTFLDALTQVTTMTSRLATTAHTPVSYTHLDVYKRQVLYMLFCRLFALTSLGIPFFAPVVPKQPSSPDTFTIGPVSYTHLDVYKRQVIYLGSNPLSISIPSLLFGKSLMCPKDAFTSYFDFINLEIVFAFVGDLSLIHI